MDKNVLHPEKTEALVGFKMTPSEKEELEIYCKDFTVSRFCRYAVKKVMAEESSKKK